jgi:hypothetical protein
MYLEKEKGLSLANWDAYLNFRALFMKNIIFEQKDIKL